MGSGEAVSGRLPVGKAGSGQQAEKVWSHDLAMPGEGPEPWMLEQAQMLILKDLPTGVIVGSAVIEKVSRSTSSGQAPNDDLFEWHLTDVERAKKLRKPTTHPQPSWFNPF